MLFPRAKENIHLKSYRKNKLLIVNAGLDQLIRSLYQPMAFRLENNSSSDTDGSISK